MNLYASGAPPPSTWLAPYHSATLQTRSPAYATTSRLAGGERLLAATQVMVRSIGVSSHDSGATDRIPMRKLLTRPAAGCSGEVVVNGQAGTFEGIEGRAHLWRNAEDGGEDGLEAVSERSVMSKVLPH